MSALVRILAFGAALAISSHAALAAPAPLAPQAQAIEQRLDALDVADRWIAGTHVNWRTGLPDDESGVLPGRHTHCSAFVAAAAEALGVYILRPPQHGQVLLANAQSEWLASEGAAAGWFPLPDAAAAQDFANRGFFVVASYHSLYDNRPGHIAIVLPGSKSPAAFAAEGPDVMQAGTFNSFRISLRDGFAGHPRAFAGGIAFYAHAVDRLPGRGAAGVGPLDAVQ